jgi:hypothetical protein
MSRANPDNSSGFARQGTQLGLVGQAGAQSRVTLAPDAKRVALVRNAPQRGNRDIWLVELALGRFVSRANSSASASMAESIPCSSGVEVRQCWPGQSRAFGESAAAYKTATALSNETISPVVLPCMVTSLSQPMACPSGLP